MEKLSHRPKPKWTVIIALCATTAALLFLPTAQAAPQQEHTVFEAALSPLVIEDASTVHLAAHRDITITIDDGVYADISVDEDTLNTRDEAALQDMIRTQMYVQLVNQGDNLQAIRFEERNGKVVLMGPDNTPFFAQQEQPPKEALNPFEVDISVKLPTVQLLKNGDELRIPTLQRFSERQKHIIPLDRETPDF